jgi:hypothetical protein
MLVATLTTGRQPNMKKKNAQGELVDLDELDQSYLDVLKDAIDQWRTLHEILGGLVPKAREF